MDEEKVKKFKEIIKEILKMKLSRTEMATLISSLLTLKYDETMDAIAVLEVSKLVIHSEQFEKVKRVIGEQRL